MESDLTKESRPSWAGVMPRSLSSARKRVDSSTPSAESTAQHAASTRVTVFGTAAGGSGVGVEQASPSPSTSGRCSSVRLIPTHARVD